MWVRKTTKLAFQLSRNIKLQQTFVTVMQHFVFVYIYYRTKVALGCVVHNRAMFLQNAPPIIWVTNYWTLTILTQITKQGKYLGLVGAIL